MIITLDRAAGTAELKKTSWSTRVAIADLPRWWRFTRALWSRGAKRKDQPGPWARFYEEDLRALERAIEEAENGRD